MDKNITTPAKPPRVSVPVSAEVLEVFQRLAKAGNMSTGKAMAEWLSDTLEAAKSVASAMERARQSPRLVALEIDAYARGLADETGDLLRKVRAAGLEAEGARLREESASNPAADSVATPPVSNTGGKVPKVTSKRRGTR